jgi:hypothetical protein
VSSIHEKFRNEKRKIKARLEAALHGVSDSPMLSANTIKYEVSERTRAIAHGGLGAIHQMVKHLHLPEMINERLKLFKVHNPYFESDHVLNIAYNALCGGQTLDDIELRRNDLAALDALGAASIPDPTTAGDFCRRFEEKDIDILQDAINEKRLEIWRGQPTEFFDDIARIDADGTMVETSGECKEGMDISHDGTWGYHPLLVSFANTSEPLYLLNRSGNRPSHEGVVPYFDKAIALCRRAGFETILLRGDTDFSLTKHFDRWDDTDVLFTFGYDAKANVIAHADAIDEDEYSELVRRAEHAIATKPRLRPTNYKQLKVEERGFTTLKLIGEDLVEFMYRPHACDREYLMVAVRKTIAVEKGQQHLFDEVRYFFYITNAADYLLPDEVVAEVNQRCNQENLIAQLKGGVRALHAPVNTLTANGAYMVITALAWTLKAWMGLLLPVSPRWRQRHLAERKRIITMEFRSFVNAFIMMPCQIVRTGRQLIYRLLTWRPSLSIFWRFANAFKS